MKQEMATVGDLRGALSKRQLRVIDAYIQTGNRKDALKAGGYSEEDERNFFELAPVEALIAKETLNKAKRGAFLAQCVLEEITSNKDAKDVARVAGASRLLHRWQWIQEREQNMNRGSSSLNELSVDELRAMVERLENARADSAKPVIQADVCDVTPQEPDLIG